MTKSLSCRDVERFVLEGEDRAFSAGEQGLVEEHLRACARCRGFAADRGLVRAELAGVRWPAPPDELVLRTRQMLRDAGTAARAAVPAWILIALAVVTIITSVWLAVTLPDITPDTTLADLPLAARAAVFIIVQNALMLICAPIVLRTARARRGELESARS
jgi:predicted anti-sigma-YlaC factor YlaD